MRFGSYYCVLDEYELEGFWLVMVDTQVLNKEQ